MKDELLLRTLCKISPVSIRVVDIKNRELICNCEWSTEQLGYTEEEFFTLSHNLFEKLVHPDDRPIQLKAYQSVFEQPEAPFQEFTIRVLKKNGVYEHVQIRLAVLAVDESKKPKTVLSIATNVEEVVALKERIERQVNKLDLISFKNSHELRGPVASILGLVQLIEHDGFDGSHAKEIIDSLKRAVIKLDAVIHEINEHAFDE